MEFRAQSYSIINIQDTKSTIELNLTSSCKIISYLWKTSFPFVERKFLNYNKLSIFPHMKYEKNIGQICF